MNKSVLLTKHVSSLLFVVYLFCLPVWILKANWYHFIIGYFCYWFMADVVQSLFMHRWASHDLWDPPVLVQKILSVIGVVGLLGTPISWAAWHRTHHAYSDSNKDPHSPVYKNYLYILFANYHYAEIKRAKDRMSNKFFLFLGKNELYFILFGNLMLFYCLSFVWFLTLWAIPVSYTIFNTNFFVNIISHKNGKAKNMSKFLWFLIFSDGIHHGSHHEKPKLNYTSYDPAGFLINRFGWTRK
jgi:stearoyl-CoA desaturase (delta-9 desaturase)